MVERASQKEPYKNRRHLRRGMKHGMQRGIYLLPNLFTTANLFLGFFSIIKSWNYLLGRQDTLFESGIFLFGASVADMLDGRVARSTNTASRFGTELDSLADLVSFGVAPAMMLFAWGLHDDGRIGFTGMFLYLACAALRLARFNVQSASVEKSGFQGLPTPISGLFLVSSMMLYEPAAVAVGVKAENYVLLLTYILSALMISEVPYRSFKTLSLTSRKPFYYLLIFVLICMLVAIKPFLTLWTMGGLYIIAGPLEYIWRKISPKYMKREKIDGRTSWKKINTQATNLKQENRSQDH